jgi:hypothetical protein
MAGEVVLRWISSADGSGGGKVWFLLDWVWISAI